MDLREEGRGFEELYLPTGGGADGGGSGGRRCGVPLLSSPVVRLGDG